MSLIKLEKIGYGIHHNVLDIEIAIPAYSYIKEFWVANQDQIFSNGVPFSGINYIQEVINTEENMSAEKAFKKLFKEIRSTFINDQEYKVYTINYDCIIFKNSNIKGVPINRKDLMFVTACLSTTQSGNDSYGYGSKKIEYTDDVETFTLYDVTALKVKALKYVKLENINEGISDSFIDKILQIKAIEFATVSNDFYRAALYWKKFYTDK